MEGIDLTTEQGWAAARARTVAAAERGPLGPAATAVTDANGVARLNGLPVGLYLVTSVSRGGSYAPFLITLPAGGEAGWNYAPVVYAKPGSWPAPPTIILPPFPFPVPWPGSSGDSPGGGTQPGGSSGSDAHDGAAGPGAPGVPGGSAVPVVDTTPRPSRPGEDGSAHSPDQQGASGRGALPVTGTELMWILGAGILLVGVGLLIRLSARGREGAPDNGRSSNKREGA